MFLNGCHHPHSAPCQLLSCDQRHESGQEQGRMNRPPNVLPIGGTSGDHDMPLSVPTSEHQLAMPHV